MTVCALTIARDEADIIEATVRHTRGQVDAIVAADHRSEDGTREILADLYLEGVLDSLHHLDGRGHDRDDLWTRLAHQALEEGHEWAVIADADDVWLPAGATGVERVSDVLDRAPADVLAVAGPSFMHVPTAADGDEPDPLRRIGWRRSIPDARKVAFRLRPDVRFSAHCAFYGGEVAAPAPGLAVRHFSIRSADQLVRKIRNGMDAADHADGGPSALILEGWAGWRGLDDAAIRERFYAEFWSADPHADETLLYDPASVGCATS